MPKHGVFSGQYFPALGLNTEILGLNTDYLSRHSISSTEEDSRQTKDLVAYVNYIFQSPVIEPAISLAELKDVLNKDRVALKLQKAIENGTIDKNDTGVKCFLRIFNKLYVF